MRYYIAINNQHFGPYTVQELKARDISPDTYVWCEGMPSWLRAADVEEIRQAMVSPMPEMPPMASSSSGDAGAMHGPNAGAYESTGTSSCTTQPDRMDEPPKTWLVESILVTIFCFWPFGVVGIVKAAETSQAINRGDYAAAERASRSAGFWTKLSFWIVIGVIVAVLGAVLIGRLISEIS